MGIYRWRDDRDLRRKLERWPEGWRGKRRRAREARAQGSNEKAETPLSNVLFGLGKQNIGNKAMNLGSDTLKATLLTMSSSAGKIYMVNSASNAGPIVIGVTSATGITTGDICVVGGVGGNTAANGTWQVTVSGNNVTLLTKLDGNNSQGNGAYTSGGWLIDVSSASTLADVSANSNGTDPSLTSVTNTLGVINAATITWSGLTATKSWAIALYNSTASNDLIGFIDGTAQVYVVTQANSTATSIAVQRLAFAIANSTTLVFSDGSSATLTAQANVGDTSLTVSSLAATVHRQATADVVTYNTTLTSTSGLPFTPGAGGGLTYTVDTGANKLFVL